MTTPAVAAPEPRTTVTATPVKKTKPAKKGFRGWMNRRRGKSESSALPRFQRVVFSEGEHKQLPKEAKHPTPKVF